MFHSIFYQAPVEHTLVLGSPSRPPGLVKENSVPGREGTRDDGGGRRRFLGGDAFCTVCEGLGRWDMRSSSQEGSLTSGLALALAPC